MSAIFSKISHRPNYGLPAASTMTEMSHCALCSVCCYDSLNKPGPALRSNIRPLVQTRAVY